ncbi:MAG: adenylate/guanylate cyclase domain-containing protein [Polyangiaceae bacterium]
MNFRLTTVRAKLTALVAFSAVVTLTALPVLSWIMHRQLIDEVDDRVPEAVRGFRLELKDDLRNLQTTVRQLASQESVRTALTSKSPDGAKAAGKIFHEAYPSIDFVFYDVDAKLIAAIGVESPTENAHLLAELAGLVADQPFTGVVEHGCESNLGKAPPAFMSAWLIKDVGIVVACLPLDADYLKDDQEKLAVELAFLEPNATTSFGATPRFPVATIGAARSGPALVEDGERYWALQRVAAPAMVGLKGQYITVIALDVTDVQNIVRQNLLVAMGILVGATLLSIILGARLANIMSRALDKVNVALRKLEQQEYVHVETVTTGDELEDLATGFNTMVDGLKERDKLRNTFGKYMTQTVMEHLMSGKVQLGGESLTVSILFSDIRSFTTISEQMNDAQALVGLLNEYFTEMVTIVMEEDGVVDKYIGDAIMAVFGAPVSKPDDAVRAVRAAVRMRKALADLNVRLVARGVPALRTGIGIHTGEVVAGNIGSEARMEYTVIGDAVNLASRLESNTKEMGVDVLISEDTFKLVEGTCIARPIREITVKGRAKPVMTYEVQGLVESEAVKPESGAGLDPSAPQVAP